MKMKEVLRQTGLTDRAVRLYLDERLICPSVSENYTGRKSIDFSQDDVDRLRQIALLRRADFSIAEIRSMISEPLEIGDILREHVRTLSDESQRQEQIVRALETVTQTPCTLQDVCAALENAARENCIPPDDLQPAYVLESERAFVRFTRWFSGILFLLGAGLLVFSFVFWKTQFRFCTFTPEFLSAVWLPCHVNPIALTVMNGVMLLLGKNAQRLLRRRFAVNVLTILSVIAVILSFFSTLICAYAFPAYLHSETSDPAQYLRLDKGMQESRQHPEIFDALFPQEIPQAAGDGGGVWPRNSGFAHTTRYYYAYVDCFAAEYDVFAQWTLPQAEYDAAKSAAAKHAVRTEHKGAWTCISYTDISDYDPADGCEVLLFAYNDATRTVRYIAALSHYEDTEPYYLSLDW